MTTWSQRTGGALAPIRNMNCSTRACSTSDRYFDVFVEYAKNHRMTFWSRSAFAIADPKRPRSMCCRLSGSAISGHGGRAR